ncbi:unnamed protein product, partial [Ectocarpus sp. 13 AM-2016]
LEDWGIILIGVRRVFQPLQAKVLLGTIGTIVAHTLLQLALYRVSMMQVYFLLILLGIFASTFFAWRGKAFFLAVQAARQSRRTRRFLTRPPTLQTGRGVGVEHRNAGRAPSDPLLYSSATSITPDRHSSSSHTTSGPLAAAGLASSPTSTRRAQVDETSNLLGMGGSPDALPVWMEEAAADGEEDGGEKKKWNPAAVAAGGAVALAVAPGAVALAGVVVAARAATRAAKSKSSAASSSSPSLVVPALPADDPSTEGAADGTSEGAAASTSAGHEDSPPALPERAARVDRPGGSIGRIAAGFPATTPAAAAAAAPRSSLPLSPSRQASVAASTEGQSCGVAGATEGGAVDVDTDRAQVFSHSAGSFNSSRSALNYGSLVDGGGGGFGDGSGPVAKIAAPGHSGMLGEPEKKPEGDKRNKFDEQEREERTESRAERFLHGPSRLLHKISGKHHRQNRSRSQANAEDDQPSDSESIGSGRSHNSGRWHRPHWGRSSKKHDGDADVDK